uniref:Uncharacterized protein n=1 Tax=Arundo donax TaxID=35708 RepID=A0A0A9BSF4_ARUDO
MPSLMEGSFHKGMIQAEFTRKAKVLLLSVS